MMVMSPRKFSSLEPYVDEFLARGSLSTSDEQACPYLPGLQARNEGFAAVQMPADLYRVLMDRGFRRSGRLIYRPACATCSACRQLRVPTGDFVATRSQRRIQRKNRDVTVTSEEDPEPTAEKWDLFRSYLEFKHDGKMLDDYGSFVDFLYESPVPVREFSLFIGGDLVGVSIVDVCPQALSSVYMYFSPEFQARSLGTFSILWEIEYCRRKAIPYYYLGYYVPGAPTMSYKGRFRPHEVLDESLTWQRVEH
jgi:arginine-tRNA-protein transferase